MLRQRTRALQAAAALVDAAAVGLAFLAAYYGAGKLLRQVLQQHAELKVILPVERYLWLLWASVPMWWLLFGLFGCYDFSLLERRRQSLARMVRPLLMGSVAVGAAVFFSKELEFARRVVGGFIVANIALLVIGRFSVLTVAARMHRAGGTLRRVLVVGTGPAARDFGQEIRTAGWGLQLAGYVALEPGAGDEFPNCVGNIKRLPEILDENSVDDVVLADPTSDLAAAQGVIKCCEEVGVAIHIPPRFFQAALSRPHLETFSGIPMLTFTTTPYTPLALGIKRTTDIVGSLMLLAVFGVPMLAFAIVIRLASPGKAIFSQERCGLYGRRFVMYKFRSMHADAEQRRAELDAANEMDGPVFKMRADPRITPFGRFLRRYSLDELPQLWNVFNGDMSLIGPRPPLLSEVDRYERWQRRRLSMRPGLTCIWQVSDRNTAMFDKWMEYDLYYIDHWSLWLDLKIAVLTIPAVIKGTGV